MDDTSLWPSPRPIREAPIKKGEPYGPCIIFPGLDGFDRALGEWDGDDWYTYDVFTRRLAPTHYTPLPPRLSSET